MATRKEVAKIKADFILKREDLLRGKMSVAQIELFDLLFDKYLRTIAKAKVTAAEQAQALAQIEKVVRTFAEKTNTIILKEYVESARTLGDLNMEYFATLFDDPEKLDLIKKNAAVILNKKLGVNDDGTLIIGGFVDKMIKDTTIRKKILKVTRKAITQGYSLNRLKREFKLLIEGNEEVTGLFDRHYNTFAKNILNSIDNANSKIFADSLGLKHAIYAGGLITTSRSICIQYNGTIFTTKQIEALENDPRIVEMYKKDPAAYNPFELPGGYGCRHRWDYITKDLAENIPKQNAKARSRNKKFVKDNIDASDE